MIDSGSVLLERVSLLTPMAIRFWDQATRSPVRDGLAVKVRPATGAGRAVTAMPNRSGVFVARGLPGLREPESGAGDAGFWDTLPSDQVRPFVIDVIDLKGRFLPWSIEADLPQRGFVMPACLSSLPPMPGVPLFSSPARPPVPGAAMVRVEIEEVPADRPSGPARWAFVQVKVGTETALGLTDERGSAALIAPYPKPGNGSTVPLSDSEWAVELKVRYAPDETGTALPVLCRSLGQDLIPVFRHRTGPEVFTPQAKLRFGRELVLADDASGKVFVRPTA
jgi:hypothetical protein